MEKFCAPHSARLSSINFALPPNWFSNVCLRMPANYSKWNRTVATAAAAAADVCLRDDLFTTTELFLLGVEHVIKCTPCRKMIERNKSFRFEDEDEDIRMLPCTTQHPTEFMMHSFAYAVRRRQHCCRRWVTLPFSLDKIPFHLSHLHWRQSESV